MAEEQNATNPDNDELPFVAPCRKLSPLAPFRWLRLGFRDLVAAPQQSLAYGLAVALLVAYGVFTWFFCRIEVPQGRVAVLIAKTGENMKIERFARFELGA